MSMGTRARAGNSQVDNFNHAQWGQAWGSACQQGRLMWVGIEQNITFKFLSFLSGSLGGGFHVTCDNTRDMTFGQMLISQYTQWNSCIPRWPSHHWPVARSHPSHTYVTELHASLSSCFLSIVKCQWIVCFSAALCSLYGLVLNKSSVYVL